MTDKTIVVCDDLVYYPDTGLLFRTSKVPRHDIKNPMGTLTHEGYLQCTYKGKQVKLHRLIWKVFYGEWPTEQIDHKNGNKSDNRISNLRQGNSVNQHNRKMPLPSSGMVGASWNKSAKKFCSSIRINGKVKYLGAFNCPTAAHIAYMREKLAVLSSE